MNAFFQQFKALPRAIQWLAYAAVVLVFFLRRRQAALESGCWQ